MKLINEREYNNYLDSHEMSMYKKAIYWLIMSLAIR
jgi:hypothetical protein